jgi:hypothetical protein
MVFTAEDRTSSSRLWCLTNLEINLISDTIKLYSILHIVHLLWVLVLISVKWTVFIGDLVSEIVNITYLEECLEFSRWPMDGTSLSDTDTLITFFIFYIILYYTLTNCSCINMNSIETVTEDSFWGSKQNQKLLFFF